MLPCPILNAIKFFLFDWGNNKSSNARWCIYSYLMWSSNIHMQFLKRPLVVDSKARAKQTETNPFAVCYKTHNVPHLHNLSCESRACFPVRKFKYSAKFYIFSSTWKFCLMVSQAEAEIHGLYSFIWHLDGEVMQRSLLTRGEEMGKSCVESWAWFNVRSGANH